MKPVLLATNHAPPERVPAFAALHEREGIEVALYGGALRHGAAPADHPLPFPSRRASQRGVHALAASGRYRAVIGSLAGRVAPLAGALGARRADVPFVLWTALWAHPRSAAHALSYLPARWLYARADAVVAYGPHVADYARARGARNLHVAPQAVDARFWSAPAGAPRRLAAFQAAFVGRDDPEKGVAVLVDAWGRAALGDDAALVLVGPAHAPRDGGAIHAAGPQPAAEVRNFLGGSDVLVVPSLRTATFREPWALVVNEAMHQHLPVIASTEVGAAAGGLVRDGRNGLVVPAGDAAALAGALRRLHDDPALRARMGAAGAEDVGFYTPEAWAAGVSSALRSVGASRSPART
jgi:glycosyltransferase involved in cell wall biosynthesis